MLMPTLTLKNFLALVPGCEETIAIAGLLEVSAAKKSDRIIVVNAQQQPLGIIYTSRLQLHLDDLSKVKKQRLLKSTLQNNHLFLEPLKILPVNWCL